MSPESAIEPAKISRKISAKKAFKTIAGKALALFLALVLSVMALASMPRAASGAPQAAAETTALPVEERFGVAHSHLPLYDAPTLEKNLDPLQSAGIGWARSVFAWVDLETQQGVWDFARFDNYVDMAAAHGVNILGILLTSPGWANGDAAWNSPPTDMAAWKDYVRRVATRYRGRVAAWEVWNEENIEAFWPSPDFNAYMALLVETSRVIREVDPSAKIVMGGVAGTDPDWLHNCLTAGAGDYVDAIAYHPYPEGFIPFNYTPQEASAKTVLQNARRMIADHSARPLEIWLTELGWTTSTMIPPGVDEATQGAYMLRTLITYAGTDVDKVFYYKNWDDYNLPWWPDFCYGMLRNDFTPKPAYFYYQRFMEVFGEAGRESSAGIIYDCDNPQALEAHAFEPGDGTLALAAWKIDDVPDSLSLTVEGRDCLDPAIVDLTTGARTALSAGVSRDVNGNIRVEGLAVGKLPVILEFRISGPRSPSRAAEPGSPASTWYLAEGCTAGGMETWVLIQNPGTEDVTVSLALQTGAGERKPEGLQDQPVPAGSRRSFNLGAFITEWDVSTRVEASGEVICERAMYGDNRAWAHDSVGVAMPASTWYLAEGCTAGGMETWVLIQNPGTEDVTVSLALQTGAGERKPEGLQDQPVPAGSRRSFNLGAFITEWDVSTRVEASGEVICERAMYGDNRAWAHDSVGVAMPASTWYLAEGCTAGGMETWVLIQNPGTEDVTVSLALQTGAGERKPEGLQDQPVPAGSRRSFNLGAFITEWDVSTRVEASGEVICERAMYGDNRAWAHDSVGVAMPASTWYLAEGCTAGGMETWVLIQNPGTEDVTVSLALQTGAGERKPEGLQDQPVPAGSRRSFNLGAFITEWDVSTRVEASGEVICERAMYGDNRAWAHDSVGHPR